MTDGPSDRDEISADDISRRLRAQLGAGLPGLSDSELDGLTERTRAELDRRVPEALAADLDAVDEFVMLSDFDRWYHSNKPACRVTAAIVTARLIAQVIEAVATADPASVQGQRHVIDVVPLSLQVIEDWLRDDGREVSRWGERAVVTFVPCRKLQSSMLIAIGLWLDSQPPLLTVTGISRDLYYPTDREDAVRDFVTKWNADRAALRSSTITEALFVDTMKAGQCEVHGEVSTLMPAEVSRDYVLAVINRAAAAIEDMFDKLVDELPPPSAEDATE